MIKEVSTLTAIPKIGDKVEIRHQDGVWYPAEICTENECILLAPHLFGVRPGELDWIRRSRAIYGLSEGIVCYKHEQPVECANSRHGPAKAGFLIARFGLGPDYEYNYNIRMST